MISHVATLSWEEGVQYGFFPKPLCSSCSFLVNKWKLPYMNKYALDMYIESSHSYV